MQLVFALECGPLWHSMLPHFYAPSPMFNGMIIAAALLTAGCIAFAYLKNG